MATQPSNQPNEMNPATEESQSDRPILIIKKARGSPANMHQGGSWKIAYADFVTAMMAFFLLMWLISSTSEEQKRGIADYFDPISIGKREGGSLGVMGGMSIKERIGSLEETSSRIQLKPTPPMEKGLGGQHTGSSEQQNQNATNYGGLSEEERTEYDALNNIMDDTVHIEEYVSAQEEAQAFEQISENIKQTLEKIPELKELNDNVIIEETKEGLRIQIVDQNKVAMFPSGSSRMYEPMNKILMVITKAIKDIPNKISVTGHTDAVPYSSGSIFTNWELSAERANASRRALIQSGIDDKRFDSVIGRAATDLFDVDNPLSAQNRRISIVLLRDVPADPVVSG